MAEVFFEDKPVEICEDRVVLNTEYDIKDDVLITKKSIEKTITSKIFYYDDLSAYLKFDDSGPQEIIDLCFASSLINGEKKILSAPMSANIKLKRIQDKYFHAKVEDPANDAGSFTFVTISETGVLTSINLNYTDLEHFEIVDDELILINYYEKIDEKKTIWTSGVYTLGGKIKKTLYDKKISNSCNVQMVVETLPNGKRFVVIYLYQKDKKRRVAKFKLKDMPKPKTTAKKKKSSKPKSTTKPKTENDGVENESQDSKKSTTKSTKTNKSSQNAKNKKTTGKSNKVESDTKEIDELVENITDDEILEENEVVETIQDDSDLDIDKADVNETKDDLDETNDESQEDLVEELEIESEELDEEVEDDSKELEDSTKVDEDQESEVVESNEEETKESETEESVDQVEESDENEQVSKSLVKNNDSKDLTKEKPKKEKTSSKEKDDKLSEESEVKPEEKPKKKSKEKVMKKANVKDKNYSSKKKNLNDDKDS